MDRIAAHAGTTKRTLYAHFVRKEDLFLAVFDLVLNLQLEYLRTPADYDPDPEQSLLLFCARFLEIVLSTRPLRLFRLAIAETERFAQGTAQLHEVMFERVQIQLAQFLLLHFNLTAATSHEAAQQLLARLLYPRFTRALFGLTETGATRASELGISPLIEVADIRASFQAVLAAVR